MNQIKAIDVIDLLPFELANALMCDPFFNDIPVVVAERGNVLAEIERLQSIVKTKGGKWGVAVVVLQMVADDPYPEIAFGCLKLLPSFQVFEIPAQNNSTTGTGKTARKVCRMIINCIKPLRLLDLTTDFVFRENCIEPVQLDRPNMVGYQVNAETYEADTQPLSQVLMPTFSGTVEDDVDKLVMACETAGAQIWFTTDDSFPIPPNKANGKSTAQLYGSPIEIPVEGFTVRAIALKDGMIASPVMRAQIAQTEINP